MLVKQALLRGGIPLVIMTVLSLIMKQQGIDSYQVRSTFVVGLIVTAVAASSVIYEIEGWSLTRQSVVHFLVMLVTVFPCLLLSGWFELNNAASYFKVFGIFMLVGAVLWSVFYLIFGKLLNK